MGEFTVKLGAVIIVLVAVLEGYCSAQAPGDEDNRCLKSPYGHTYEDNVKILMDSYNYLQLLPGNGTGNPPIASALWNDRSFDGNDIVSTTAATYWQQSAGTCQFQIKVCGFRQPGVAQDNWLFTQHISKSFDANTNNYPVEILVDITYALQSCRSNRIPQCNTRFKLYRYINNSQQLPSTSGDGFMNKDNYMTYASFGTATPAATGARYTETHRFTLQPQQTSFYIAIEDTGTCVIISRLLVYRHNCKSMQTELVLYPETAAPVSGSSNEPTDIDITCVPNADIVGSPHVTCDSDGEWGPQNPRCECRGGYEDRGTECRACLPGYYRSLTANGCDDRSCCLCPANTKTDQVAAAQCECLDGYFRNSVTRDNTCPSLLRPSEEQVSAGCTQPPSIPRNMVLTSLSATNDGSRMVVSWSAPSEGGRSDLYYVVEHSDPDTAGQFIGTTCKSSTSHTFTGLRAFTQYCFQVSAHNGVSDQDPDNVALRTVEQCMQTPEARPASVVDLQSLYPVVLWQAPEEPNGIILHYELTFIPKDGATTTKTTDGPQTYYIIETTDLPSGSFQVEVRARNGADIGESTCSLTIDPDERSTAPKSCVVCPKQTDMLVHYPVTQAPETGTTPVTTACVQNAHLTAGSSSLSVTCDPSGIWGGQSPQCECDEGFVEGTDQSGDQICRDNTTTQLPTPTPPVDCLTCPEGIRVAESCTDVYIIWEAINGALQYRLRIYDETKSAIIRNETVETLIFNIRLNDSVLKDKVLLIEIGAAFSEDEMVTAYSERVKVNIPEIVEKCDVEGESDNEAEVTTAVAISVIVTFIATALAVGFLVAVIALVLSARKIRGVRREIAFSSNQYSMDSKEKGKF